VGGQIYVLHHEAAAGMSLDRWYDRILAVGKLHGWQHGTDYVPHDAGFREWTSGRTRIETMQHLPGLNPMRVPQHNLDDGINAVRRILPLCVFHPRCETGGLDALEQYRREWDDDAKTFKKTAVHDWTSHPADAFRYLCMGFRRPPPRVVKAPKPRGIVIPPPRDDRRGMRL
jgi:hypothetical protein